MLEPYQIALVSGTPREKILEILLDILDLPSRLSDGKTDHAN